MNGKRQVYIGTDSGATTSKTGGVWDDGTNISTKLLQKRTNSESGPDVVVEGWMEGINEYLHLNGLAWDQVAGVGVAMPGTFSI